MTTKMTKKPEAWSTSCLASISTAHRALSYLYDGLEKDDAGMAVTTDNVLYPTKENWTFPDAAKQFIQSCQNLSNKLSVPTEGIVRLPVGGLLKLVSRCLNITFTDVSTVPSLSELLEFLPKIHKTALNILSYLILCCGTNLLPNTKFILDLCLHVLVSTERIEEQSQSETRACVYCVLSLWLEMAGLGTHYLTKIKDFHRELISDISLTQRSVQPANGLQRTGSDTDKRKKKGKGKKKGSRRAESYLQSAYANATKGSIEARTPLRVSSTLGALQVSRLAAERGQFLPLQSLMRCVLDTASTLQRQSPEETSPFADVRCRSSLYHTVFTFGSVSLDKVTNSSDTVAHFQLTNRALSTVLHASFSDPSIEVQRVCQNLLSSCPGIGLVDRPIVRKILPEEQVETRDVGEMDRQMEELKEENERLKSKLLEAHMESQRKSCQMAELREELATRTQANTSDPGKSQEPSLHGSESEEDEDVEEINQSNTDNEEDDEKVETKSEKTSNQNGDDTHSTQDTAQAVDKVGKKKKSKKDEQDSFMNEGAQGRSESSLPDLNSSDDKSDKKRRASLDEDVNSKKKSKLESLEDEQSEDVQAMLLDFVDADPDTD